MILVAGLAVAGLAGIAVAFYLSMRPSGARARAGATSRAGRSRPPARIAPPPSARSGSGRAVDRPGSPGSSTVIDFTGPQRVLADPEPAVTGHRARHGDRRRVGWRKGSDIDKELWPVEAFGVSDEQFWDDLAADRPLTTTARPAQPETAARRRPNAGPLPDLYPGDGRGRTDGRRGAAEGAGTHPQPGLGPDDRTAIQPVHAARQHAQSRGRSHAGISADEDPLTSPAYSLRPKGSVNGRSYSARLGQPSHSTNGHGRTDAGRSDPPRPRPDPPRPQPDPLRSSEAYGRPVPNPAYPYSQLPYSAPAQPVTPQPYGEQYGYRRPAGPAGPGDDPRRANDGRSPGRAGGNGAGDGSWGSRPAYPPVNGDRGPYDPRAYRRPNGLR